MPCPHPLPNESREDYTIRAHQLLMGEVPDPYQRNQVVWQASDKFFGDLGRQRAESWFPAEQFEHRRDMCHWFEHEVDAIGPNGQPTVRKNDVNRIKAIVQENNLRIADTDAYAAIIDKHTAPPNQPVPEGHEAPPPPKTIGFSGSYRIGMIGRIHPKFALFADEYRSRDALQVFKDRPRRSVEVLTLRANGRSYIDATAALSEAPRLPLPVQYSPGSHVTERYQAEAVFADAERYEGEGAYAGGSNTFLPGGGFGPNKNTDKFGAVPGETPVQQTESDVMPLGPEDLQQIVQAIQSTPQFQFLNTLMQGQGGDGGADPSGMGQGAPADPAAPAPPSAPPAQPGAPAAPAAPPAAPPAKEPYIAPLAAAGMMAAGSAGLATANRFSANEPEHETEVEMDRANATLNEQYAALTEQYAALSDNITSLAQENAALKAGYAELKMTAADAQRRQRISELHGKFPSFVNPQDEAARCLYSAGSTMDDAEFDRHIEMVESYAARVPAITPMVPGGVMPDRFQDRSVESEKYEADLSKMAVEVFTSAQAAGEKLTYEQAREKAKAQLG